MTDINVGMNRVSGKLRSLYPALNPINVYKTASAYTPTITPFQMRATTMLPKSGADAYHKWASTKFQYKARVAWTGGQPPFRVTLVDGPDGMTMGASGLEQTMTRTLDGSAIGVYYHTLPANNFTVLWSPSAGDSGTTNLVMIMVEDNAGSLLLFRYYVTVDDTKYIFVDASAPDDTGTGTWASPKKLFSSAHNNPNKICAYKDGTYAVTFGGLNNSDNKVRNHIGIGSNVVFDMTAQQFGASTSATDIAFINIEFNGCLSATANPRVFNMNGKTDRIIFFGCRWESVNKGTTGNDNPACIFFGNLGSGGPTPALPLSLSHTNITLAECSVDTSVSVQQIVCFSVTGVLVEQCTATMPTTAISSNGGYWLHMKDSCNQATIRYCVGTGSVDNGAGNGFIGFSNQTAYHCGQQEVICNTLYTNNASGVVFNLQALIAGNTGIGQNIGAVNQRVVRNTLISTTSGAPMSMARWAALAGMQPVTIQDNLLVTAGATTVGFSGNSDGYTLVGDNTKRALSDVDGSYKLTGSLRISSLGKVGAEIASTLVS